ncbi:PREDICTED: B3 domain-containing protein At2g16210-like [Camelina sativa]|uniref:B3 domain-containing protein At2g16210-like n=1 Tax=Camelina sativa TaxID=90675 RepID=A0ABM0XPJ7_CAMSA|nr:PREDICTED: B3 domain-containing protein At2g16210-like [Camelina sativa]
MTRNSDFLGAIKERNNGSFFMILQTVNVSSECMRALPHDFTRSFSDKELSCKMKIRTQWGRSWEVGISKNPRFYFMEMSGWEKFVSDNALGHSEFITFTHKRKMDFTVNIFKQDGKEMIQPPQPAAFLASSSSIKIEQEGDDKREEVVVPSELSNRGRTTAAESNGRELKFGKKPAEGSQSSKRAEKLVFPGRGSPGASSSTAFKFTIIIKKPYLLQYLLIPKSVANYHHMPKKKATFKIHHPDGKRSWDVTYLLRETQDIFSAGWLRLCKDYPLAVGNTCEFTLIKPKELLLVVSIP